MARYTGPVCKFCRRDGTKLFLKGERCYTDKCSFDRRPYPPGQHGQRRSKNTEYGIRLREKQKVKRMYGMVEKQFQGYFEHAHTGKGITGQKLLQRLERRLDNIIYRMGLARTRSEARQRVLHKHILVNDKIVNVPSYLISEGDEISIKESSQNKQAFNDSMELGERRINVDWIEFNKDKKTAVIKSLPSGEDLGISVQEQLIVEFYSR